MRNLYKLIGVIALLAVIGFSMAACPADDDSGNNGNGSEEALPASSGINAVSGKTYYESTQRTVFSTTADGDGSGTYVVYTVDNGTYGPGVKFTYTTQIKTGTYSWNEEAKTVTLKPEKIGFSSRGSSSDGSDGAEFEYEWGAITK